MESGSGVSPVLLVVPRLALGGTERQIALLAGGLRRCGIDARVVVLFSGGARERDLRAQDVPYVVLGLPDSPGELWRLPRRLIRLYRLLRQVRPAVVHAFLFEAYVLLPPVARLARVPVVVAGRRALSAYKGSRRWAFWLERAANRFVDVFVANAIAVAQDTASVEHVAAERIVVIPNAVDEESFVPPLAAAEFGPGPVVVCVANLFPYKGHVVLLRAAQQLASAGVPFRLVLIGDGPARGELEREARERDVDVQFLGQRSDVAAFLEAADIVVLPSLHEGMSNAVLEAMALGCAVVATDVGGTAEALGSAGVLCRPNDVGDLADALRRVLGDSVLRDSLGVAARDRARREFSVEQLVERHIAVYGRATDVRTSARRGGH